MAKEHKAQRGMVKLPKPKTAKTSEPAIVAAEVPEPTRPTDTRTWWHNQPVIFNQMLTVTVDGFFIQKVTKKPKVVIHKGTRAHVFGRYKPGREGIHVQLVEPIQYIPRTKRDEQQCPLGTLVRKLYHIPRHTLEHDTNHEPPIEQVFRPDKRNTACYTGEEQAPNP